MWPDHCLVKNPIIWATKPGTGDSIWSTEMTSPGVEGFESGSSMFLVFARQGLLVALAYMHAEHNGMLHFAKHFGSIPNFAMSCSFVKLMCPNR